MSISFKGWEKKLILTKTNGIWRIVAEEWEKLVGRIAIGSDRTDLPDPGDKIIVKSIEFNVEKNRPEKVYIELNRFSVPQLIALEGKNPRIAIDIHNVFLLNEHNTIPVNGYLIKRIRTYYSRNSETLRVVLDLNPVENYNAKPTYYKVDNKYCLEISHASLKSRKTPLGETQKGKPFSDVYPQPSSDIKKHVVVKVDKGRIRESPSLKSEIEFLLQKGTIVSVIKTKGDWLFIRLKDNRKGWAHRSLFDKN